MNPRQSRLGVPSVTHLVTHLPLRIDCYMVEEGGCWDPKWVLCDVIIKNGPIGRKWNIFPIGLSKERSWKSRYGILDGADEAKALRLLRPLLESGAQQRRLERVD